jgi:phosphoribosylamine--glycine ligase
VKVLIIGSGGREHALAWKLGQSREKPDIITAPGNGGTARAGRNADLPPGDIDRIMDFIRANKVDFVVPGAELPLVNGIADACAREGVLCFGPSARAARLEGSKSFAKEVMREAGVPTADFAVFNDYDAAEKYVRSRKRPPVVKADGPAAGKGVVAAAGEEEALAALRGMMLEKKFGPAGERVVIEDTLEGEEVSLLAFCDDETVVPLPSAQDHKTALDGDRGPNTGGMGAYSPAPVLPEGRTEEIVGTVLLPVLKAVKKRGTPYSGILYAGLMLTADGPKVLEFNVRFGDPECQPLLMRFKGDLLELMVDCARGRLSGAAPEWTDETALCVVMAAEGYPGAYRKGMAVEGIEAAEARMPGKIKVFHAGTVAEQGRILASGGRVLGVTALGADLREARERAYAAVAGISFEHCFFRRDIGDKGLKAAVSAPGGRN